MPKVPKINEPEPPKRDTMIVCTRGGKPLTGYDQEQLDAFIKHVKDRKAKRRSNT